MISLDDYINKRFEGDPEKMKALWDGYEDFKIGVLLKQARKESGLTQEEVASKLKTTKSVISRIENHAEDIKLSTLEKFANAIGLKMRIVLE